MRAQRRGKGGAVPGRAGAVCRRLRRPDRRSVHAGAAAGYLGTGACAEATSGPEPAKAATDGEVQ